MSGIQHPRWREGVQRLVTVDNPPAGKDWAVTVGAKESAGLEGLWWRVKAISYIFTASAAVAGRILRVKFDAGSGGFYAQACNGNQVTASQIVEVSHCEGALLGEVFPLQFTTQFTSLPFDLRLPVGHRIRSDTIAMDVGDTYTAISLWIQELIYVPPVDLITGQLASMTDKIVAAIVANGRGNCVLAAAAATKEGAPT